MTVSLPSSLPLPGSAERTKPDQSKAEQPVRSRQPFRALLEPEGGSPAATLPTRPEQPIAYPALAGLEGGIPIEAGGQSYSLTLTSLDRAVAFEARPLVGPAFVEHAYLSGDDTSLTWQFLPPQTQPPSLPGSVIGHPQASAQGAQPRAQIDAGPAGTGGPNRSGASIRPDRAAADLMLGPRGASALASSSGPLPAAARVHDAQGPGGSAAQPSVMQAPLEQARRAQIFAHLLATTEEYHVVVRGVQASRPEQRELASAIKAAMRAYGLPDRPVVISMNEAEA